MNQRVKQEAERYLKQVNDTLRRDYTSMMNSLWQVMMTGDKEWAEQCEADERSYQEKIASGKLKQGVKRWLQRLESMEDSHTLPLIRQLHVLQGEIREHADTAELRERMTSLWNELHYMIMTYRTEFGVNKLSEHEVLSLLQSLKGEEERKRLWKSYMQSGERVAPKLLELVHLRNRVAQKQGYANYFEMKLAIQDVDLAMLESVMERIRDGLDASYLAAKRQIDNELAAFHAIPVADLRSWHYHHPFFQEDMANHLPSPIDWEQVLPLITRWFRERGFDISPILSRADITLSASKSQANCCLNIDRSMDIRLSCHLSPDERGLALLLHELGHALYEQSLDAELPFLLRQPAHTFMSEGIALLFERVATSPQLYSEWQQIPSLPSSIPSGNRIHLLIKTYWMITLIKFEQELYRDPGQSLNSLWWDLVEDIQGIARPDEWDYPYWASKAHLTTLPVYYYNYLFGEILASQLEHTLNDQFGQWHGEASLRHTRKTLMRPGALKRWDELIVDCTQYKLDPRYFIQQCKLRESGFVDQE
ncbi:M2 family metallopeptidase [Paenibacillus sp. SYP-B4298]|uniref:M2 family metallopeptidase n=1 Tax=Paenibacillus sp. SYP-B4298 TaxID=2996034 RepID=UPI0022DE79A1|nr:M2 family metallopeptidase [Paenibacillus sp. SYP-B4298]